MSDLRRADQDRIPRRTYVWLALIMVIAALLRLPDLTSAPLGGHGDVSWVGLNTLDWVDRGIWPFYIREMYAPEFPVVLLNGLLLPLTGISFLSPRLITAGTGLIFVGLLFPSTWWLMVGYARHVRIRAGLFAALSGAVSIQAMYLSRLGMESPPFLAVLTLAIWLTAWAIARGKTWQWILAGASVGFAQYIYLPARLLPVLLLAWFGFSTWIEARRKDGNNHSTVRGWLLLGFSAVLVALPAIILFVTVPGSFSGRADAGTADTGGWIWAYDTSGQGGLLGVLIKKIGLELNAFGNVSGAAYSLMGQPMLAQIFYIGFLIALLCWLRFPRKRAFVWPLIGIPVMFITDLISGTFVGLHALHQMGVLPFVFILSGIGLALGWELLVPRTTHWFGLLGKVTNHGLMLGMLAMAIVPSVIVTYDYLRVVIPAAYADPQTGWQAEQIDVDLSQRVNAAPDNAYLLPYSEYSRSNDAWLLSASFRDRRSAIDVNGQLQLPTLPATLTVIQMTSPARPRHDARPSMDDSRLWVLLYHGQTLLLPALTPAQDSHLQMMLQTLQSQPGVAAQPILDRSQSVIAHFYNVSSDFLTAGPVSMSPLKATFNHQVDLQGYTLSTMSALNGDLTPGQVLFVTLYWHIQQPVTEDYNITVQLWTDNKNALVSTTDFPFGGAYRTRIWLPNEIVATHHWLQLPADLPAARYTLAVGMLHLLGGKLVPIAGANADLTTGFALAADLRRPLPAASVTATPTPSLGLPPAFQFGDLFAVRGVQLSIAGVNQALNIAQPATYSTSAGQTVSVNLTWETLKRPPQDYTVFVHIASAPNVAPNAQTDLRMGAGLNGAHGDFPSGAWRIGERYTDQVTVTLPAQLAPGRYQLLVGIYYWQTGQRLPINGLPNSQTDASQWLIGTLMVNP